MKRLLSLCLLIMMSLSLANDQFILSHQIKTGSDDLRGGNDNLNLIIQMKSGTQVRFNNINFGGRLGDNSTYGATQIVQLGKIADVAGFRFETTLGSGMRECLPVALSDTPSSNALNRRVELIKL